MHSSGKRGTSAQQPASGVALTNTDTPSGGLPVHPMIQSRQMQWVDGFTQLLDTRLRIPGTKIRFGLDFILGLIPGAGDFISLCMSGVLIATMAKNGASLMLVFRMLGNVLLDSIVGAIPLLGNVFDLFFKANHRNMGLMRQYYVQDKHRGSAWPVLMVIFVSIVVIALLAAWLISKVFGWYASAF